MGRDIQHHTYWTAEALRCDLISRKQTTLYFVRVWDGARILCTMPCADVEDGARMAEFLWKQYVEGALA
jgi:hypothetical protein